MGGLGRRRVLVEVGAGSREGSRSSMALAYESATDTAMEEADTETNTRVSVTVSTEVWMRVKRTVAGVDLGHDLLVLVERRATTYTRVTRELPPMHDRERMTVSPSPGTPVHP